MFLRSPFKTLTALLAGLAALAALRTPRPRTLPPTLRVEQRLGAPWTTRAGAAAVADEIEVGHDRRPGLRVRAPGAWTRAFTVPPGARLRLAWDVDPPDARVTLLARLHRSRRSELLRREARRGDRGWNDLDLDLARFAGENVELELALVGAPAEVAFSTPALLGAGPGAPAPNVLVYLVDCLRADHVGAYGYARPTTPRIDALARESVTFEDAWACASWTKPSVGCLFTSLPSVRHGARTIDDALDPRVATLAEAFGAGGYASAAFVANPFVSARTFGLARGFERVQLTGAAAPGQNINSLEADAIHLNRAAIPWLKAHADQRFFLYLHSLDLHAEYRERPPFTRLFVPRGQKAREVDLYDTELAANDHSFGELLAFLRRSGLYERTLIVVTGDHGEEFGEHGTWRHGRSLNQELLHVPLIVKLPGQSQAGRRVALPVSNLDVAPTLLDLAGLPRPAGFEGLSLRPLIEGREAPPRRVLFAEQLSSKEVLYAARDARFKAVQQFLPQPARRLFDLGQDPRETRDLQAAPPREARALLAELEAWIAGGQTGYHVSIAPPAAPVEMTLEASTSARIADVQRFAVELGETLEIAADERRVTYRFRAGERARHVVLRTEPAGARLSLTLSAAGRPLSPAGVRLGLAALPATRLPLDADPARLAVPTAEVARVMADTTSPVRVFYVAPGPTAARPVVDPELQESLRALGYVQ